MISFKTHVALNVTDVERSVAFYQAMFGVAPVKHKEGYAKFDLDNPALNLTLNVSPDMQPQGSLSHLGVQVSSTEDVLAAVHRFTEAGLNVLEEMNTDCCYALQDKVWVSDPDGNRWEIFVVKVGDTAPELTVDLTKPMALSEGCGRSPCC
jgi:catechol 2,3-dioxygenase-like lactoylglutathione lyase family enzyme